MSAVPSYSPIIREVKDGGVTFNDTRYVHEELQAYNGSDVLLDMEIDVDTEKRCFRIYNMFENEICVIEISDIESIGDVIS